MKTSCDICNKNFKEEKDLIEHNKAKHSEKISKERKPLPVKKIRNWAIFILVVGLIIWGVVALINNSIANNTLIDEDQLNFEAPKVAIHWHPHLTIKINKETITIPANIGLSGTHMPTHTHETDGILHIENNRPTKETVTLGYFFKVWGRKLSKDCIFEYCTDKGELKMFVNGVENNEFENYFMQDSDEILIEYNIKDEK